MRKLQMEIIPVMLASCVIVWMGGNANATTVNANAALVYWQAFDGLPEITGEEYGTAMSLPPDKLIDKALADRVERSSRVLMLMHRATTRNHCEWDIDFRSDGAEAVLPHLTLARGMSRLALLRARQHFVAGRDSEGIADVLAVMAMARHAGRDRSLVGMLVDNSMQRMAMDVAATFMPGMSPEVLLELESGLAQLPPANTFARCMVTEGEFAPWLIRRLQQLEDGEPYLDMCAMLGLEVTADSPLAGPGGREAMIRHTTELMKLYDTLPGLVTRQVAKDADPFAEVMAQAAKNPVGEMFFPALRKAWHANRRFASQQAMFSAGLATLQRGRQELDLHRDPTDGNKFRYAETKGGFELVSNMTERMDSEEKVTLRFGVPQD